MLGFSTSCEVHRIISGWTTWGVSYYSISITSAWIFNILPSTQDHLRMNNLMSKLLVSVWVFNILSSTQDHIRMNNLRSKLLVSAWVFNILSSTQDHLTMNNLRCMLLVSACIFNILSRTPDHLRMSNLSSKSVLQFWTSSDPVRYTSSSQDEPKE